MQEWGVLVIAEPISDSRSYHLTAVLFFIFLLLGKNKRDIVYEGILSFLQYPSSFLLHPLAVLLRMSCSSFFKTQDPDLGLCPQFLQLAVGQHLDSLKHITGLSNPYSTVETDVRFSFMVIHSKKFF